MSETADQMILIVDDDAAARMLLRRILGRAGYESIEAPSAAAAREILGRERIALLLTDLNMPGTSGIDLARHVAAEHPDTATMLISGDSDRASAEIALDYGAYGYLTKPVRAVDLTVAVMNALRRRELEIARRAERDDLENAVAQRTAELSEALARLDGATRELERSHEQTMVRLARAIDCRDPEIGEHVDRMGRLAGELAGRVGLDGDVVRAAARLHDVGKIGIPDAILHKQGPLTPAERRVIETHTTIGYELLGGSGTEMLELAAKIALTHHERWDGRGYPDGLAGAVIPIEGRIAAIADVFDALTTKRCYRDGYSTEDALAIMHSERGRQFDPELLDLFLEMVHGRTEDVEAV